MMDTRNTSKKNNSNQIESSISEKVDLGKEVVQAFDTETLMQVASQKLIKSYEESFADLLNPIQIPTGRWL